MPQIVSPASDPDAINAGEGESTLPPEEPDSLATVVHKLRVHQIELETQNEELRRTQIELDAARASYFDLYDLAPIGYCTIDMAGMILQANLTAATLLGMARGQLVRRFLTRFIVKTSQDTYYLAQKQLLATGVLQACELQLTRPDRMQFWAQLDATTGLAPDGTTVMRVMLKDISKRKQAEETLRIAATAFESREGMFVTDTHSVILRVNRAFTDITGFSEADAVGRTPRLFKSGRQTTAFYADMWDSIHARGTWNGEIWNRRKTGEVFPQWMTITSVKDDTGKTTHYVGALIDITERKQAEEALLKAVALQRAIFAGVNFSSIATDAHGLIQNFSVGAERMLGYSADEVVNKVTPADLADPEEVCSRADHLSAALETRIAPDFTALSINASLGIDDIFELTYLRKDGLRLPTVVSVTALRGAQDAIIGYLLNGIDNTARKQFEAERALLDQVLQDKNIALESAKLVAEKANLAKSDFLSSMSHELRSPLNAILGFAQLIESGSPSPTATQKASVEQILQAGWYLLALINEILDLSLIESGKLSLSLEPMLLNEVLSDCHAMIEPQAQLSGISLRFPTDWPHQYVSADRTRVKQVLINLLSNAIKYNRVGGSVEVRCEIRDEKRTRISFRDTGEGLSPEQMLQLFQPFNRLGQEDRGQEGTGIGLVVSKRLVELMDGEIGVSSTVGKGSVFWVDLNTSDSPKAIAYPAPTQHAIPIDTFAAQSTQTVLCVEDNPANLMLIEQLFERRTDLRLLTASDGRSGIALARAALPDLILMDINLPYINGIQALRILSEDPATANIPVIALSANAMPHDIEKGLEGGFLRYLTKPIKVNEFMDTLDIALREIKAAEANPKREHGTDG